MTGPIVIDDVRPRTPTGRYPAKAVVGEEVTISADVFRDGHDLVAARVRWHPAPAPEWHEQAMDATGNDRWHAVVVPATLGLHEFVIEAWTDRYATWRHRASARLRARPPAGSPDEAGWLADVNVDFEIGAGLLDAWMAGAAPHDRPHFAAAVEALRGADGDPRDRLDAALTPALAAATRGPLHHGEVTASATHMLWVDRERALVGAWYELFPRSYGGLRGTIDRLPAIAAMGFDVVYLPPVHPIGRSFRKGRDNALVAGPDDPGSPWAIGAMEGGHTAIDPGLGTADDFRALMAAAHDLGLEVALDYALQCSPDHPWARDHPEWFHHRPDGTIAHAENPPKKYEDIYPLNFCPELDRDRMALWAACKAIVDHWLGEGVRIFRVDNPHTKPVAFWEWLIPAVQAAHPDAVFLAEAFTRPKMMAKLAEVGFSQSYTYFTWRTVKLGDEGLVAYVEELANGPKADFMRPNFWPNTPDILSGPLRHGSLAAFRLRLVLAATLVPSYGIYSGYELGENEPASDANEEYRHSEKYELRVRDWDAPRSLAPFITLVNTIRRRHPALWRLRNIRFHHAASDDILCFSKSSVVLDDVMLVVVNLDPVHPHDCWLGLDLAALGLAPDQPFEVFDELTGQTFRWVGANPYVRLDPSVAPAHLLHLRAGPAA